MSPVITLPERETRPELRLRTLVLSRDTLRALNTTGPKPVRENPGPRTGDSCGQGATCGANSCGTGLRCACSCLD